MIKAKIYYDIWCPKCGYKMAQTRAESTKNIVWCVVQDCKLANIKFENPTEEIELIEVEEKNEI